MQALHQKIQENNFASTDCTQISNADSLKVAIASLNAQKKTLSSYYRKSCYVVENCDLDASLITNMVNTAMVKIMEFGSVIARSESIEPKDKARRLRLSANQRKWIRNYCITNQIDIPWWVG